MPVQIKELVIRAVVNEGKTSVPRNEGVDPVETKLLKVVKELSKKNKKNER